MVLYICHCHWLAFLSAFSHLQLIQNSAPSSICWCQSDIRIVSLKWYCHHLFEFIDFKTIKVISCFNLKRMKKVTRWRCNTKKNLKTTISALLTCKCQTSERPNWRPLWRAKIQSRLNEFRQFFFAVFQFWLNTNALNYNYYYYFFFWFFDPLAARQ